MVKMYYEKSISLPQNTHSRLKASKYKTFNSFKCQIIKMNVIVNEQASAFQ